METAYFSETLVFSYKITLCYKPKYHTMNNEYHENLKTYIKAQLLRYLI
jgi:hypothetical protein